MTTPDPITPDARTCGGCGKPLRETTGPGAGLWTCDTEGCGGNLARLMSALPIAPDAEHPTLTVAEQNALDESLEDSGCHGFMGDHEPLYAVVERILADRLRVSAERETRARAEAWDEGWLASKRHERSEGQPKMSYWPNPYRAALYQSNDKGGEG